MVIMKGLLLPTCALAVFIVAHAYCCEAGQPLPHPENIHLYQGHLHQGHLHPHPHGSCIDLPPDPDLAIDFDQDGDGKLSKDEEKAARKWMQDQQGYIDEGLMSIYPKKE